EGRMADAAVGRPVRVAHLRNETRLDPAMAASGRRARGEGRGRPDQRREAPGDVGETGLVETRADLGDVDEPPVVVETEVQGPEVPPRPLGRGEAADHEVAAAPALHL